MEKLQDKIDNIKRKNGIKSFGYTESDLKIFTLSELKELNDNGLIDNIEVSKRQLSA